MILYKLKKIKCENLKPIESFEQVAGKSGFNAFLLMRNDET